MISSFPPSVGVHSFFRKGIPVTLYSALCRDLRWKEKKAPAAQRKQFLFT